MVVYVFWLFVGAKSYMNSVFMLCGRAKSDFFTGRCLFIVKAVGFTGSGTDDRHLNTKSACWDLLAVYTIYSLSAMTAAFCNTKTKLHITPHSIIFQLAQNGNTFCAFEGTTGTTVMLDLPYRMSKYFSQCESSSGVLYSEIGNNSVAIPF